MQFDAKIYTIFATPFYINLVNKTKFLANCLNIYAAVTQFTGVVAKCNQLSAAVDEGIHEAKLLDANKLLPAMDASSISGSKVFQVPETIVIKQK